MGGRERDGRGRGVRRGGESGIIPTQGSFMIVAAAVVHITLGQHVIPILLWRGCSFAEITPT